MNENKIEQESENDKKYSGGLHFFMVFGGVILILIIVKLVIDTLMK